jgi:hypothetical protein
VRAVTATSKPAAASSTAIALPMPRLAPVTKATFRSLWLLLLVSLLLIAPPRVAGSA